MISAPQPQYVKLYWGGYFIPSCTSIISTISISDIYRRHISKNPLEVFRLAVKHDYPDDFIDEVAIELCPIRIISTSDPRTHGSVAPAWVSPCVFIHWNTSHIVALVDHLLSGLARYLQEGVRPIPVWRERLMVCGHKFWSRRTWNALWSRDRQRIQSPPMWTMLLRTGSLDVQSFGSVPGVTGFYKGCTFTEPFAARLHCSIKQLYMPTTIWRDPWGQTPQIWQDCADLCGYSNYGRRLSRRHSVIAKLCRADEEMSRLVA